MIREEGKNNWLYSNLKYVDLQRNDIKTPIMTKTYNVTIIGIRDQLASKFKTIKEFKETLYLVPAINKSKIIKINESELLKIAEIINKAIFKTYPSLELIYNYFINMAKLLNKLEIPIIWFIPSGLEIIQKYYRTKQNKIAINFAGRTKKMIIKEWTDKVDKKKTKSSDNS